MDTNSPAISTGNMPIVPPILANESANMAEELTHAPAMSASASITPAELLSLLQTDCSQLQELGLRVAILAANHKIYIAIEYPGHELSAGTDGTIYINGKDVKTL